MLAIANSTISAALANGGVGISFSGAGFLIFYYIGVVDALINLGILSPAAKIAGASSGALITASCCSGLSPPQMISAGYSLAKACREEQSCSGNLDQHLKKVLQSSLPPNAWDECRGKGYITISTGSPIGVNQPLVISDFQSQDDLIAAATASSFIPLWSASSLTKMFRGMEVFDGGYTLEQPCPPDVAYCIRVSAKNPAWPQNRGIGSMFSLLGRIGRSMGSTASSSATAEAARSYPPVAGYGPDGQPDEQMLQLAAANNVDIAPGVFSKMPFAQSEWSDWALSPADDGTLKHMYLMGKFDANMWATTMGLQGTQGQQGQQQKQKIAAEQKTGKSAGTGGNWEPVKEAAASPPPPAAPKAQTPNAQAVSGAVKPASKSSATG